MRCLCEARVCFPSCLALDSRAFRPFDKKRCDLSVLQTSSTRGQLPFIEPICYS